MSSLHKSSLASDIAMMALEWEVERPVGTEIKTLTDGCVIRISYGIVFSWQMFADYHKFNMARSTDEVHGIRITRLLAVIMWSTAMLSERSLTVFPAHEWSHSAAATLV